MNKNAIIAAAGVLATLAAAGCGTSTVTATAPKTTAPAQSPSAAPASPSPTQPQQAHLGDRFTVTLEDGTKYDVTVRRVDQQASPANEFEGCGSVEGMTIRLLGDVPGGHAASSWACW